MVTMEIHVVPWDTCGDHGDTCGAMGYMWCHGIHVVPWDTCGAMGYMWCHGIHVVPWDTCGAMEIHVVPWDTCGAMEIHVVPWRYKLCNFYA